MREAPEPTQAYECNAGKCRSVYYDEYKYRQHRLEQHRQVYEYTLDEYDYQYGGKGEKFHARDWSQGWISIEKSQGRINAPLKHGGRPVRRLKATTEQLSNRRKPKTCFCGKPFGGRRRKYCSDACSNKWNFKLNSFWDGHKSYFLDSKPYRIKSDDPVYYYKTRHFCEHCKVELKNRRNIEVDHIIAIILGGHPWDYRNLQPLCSDCHKKKTKADMGILAWWRREAKYDIGLGTII